MQPSGEYGWSSLYNQNFLVLRDIALQLPSVKACYQRIMAEASTSTSAASTSAAPIIDASAALAARTSKKWDFEHPWSK